MPNQDMFIKIARILVEFPSLHNQETWEEGGRCGTTRCVAGWAVFLKAQELGLTSNKNDHLGLATRERVAEAMGLSRDAAEWDDLGAHILGLDEDQAQDLFHNYSDADARRMVGQYAVGRNPEPSWD